MKEPRASHEETPNVTPPKFCHYCGKPLQPNTTTCPACNPERKPTVATDPGFPPVEGLLQGSEGHDIKKALVLYGLLLASSALILLSPFDEEDLLSRIFIFDNVMAVIVIVMAALSWKTIARALPGGFRLIHFGIALAVATFTFIAGLVYTGVLIPLLPDNPPNIVDTMVSAGLSRWKQLAILAIYPAVFEELAFRGLFLPFLTTRMPVVHAVVASSAAFAILHMDWVYLPFLFGFGLALGWLRVTSNSLIPPMLVHFFHNGAIWIAESLK